MIPGPSATVAPKAARSSSGKALAGFLLSGFLLALPGAILPAWGAYRDQSDFSVAGNYFLCLALGLAAARILARGPLARRGFRFQLVLGCGLSCGALVWLAWFSPPASAWWRAAGLAAVGLGTGWLNMGLFQAIWPSCQADAAGSVIRGGIWYGLGCVLVTVAAAWSLYAFSVAGTLAGMAAVPALFAIWYSRAGFERVPPESPPSLERPGKDFRGPAAILFALALFFQLGNEWAIAGWLPLFLVHRVEIGLEAALVVLALYWLFLLTGRLGGVALLPHLRRVRCLVASALAALFGCLILSSTKTGFGVVSGALFLGAGYACVYPLLAKAMAHRLPYYDPRYYSGLFSLALPGALLAPATAGYAAAKWGVGIVIAIPLLGTVMVMLLIFSLWIEAKVTGR